MTPSALKSFIIALSLTFTLAETALANQVNDRAMELAGQQKFDEALVLLSQQDSALVTGYEHRFLKARILSWAGKYAQAESVLNSLIAEDPDNPDLRLAMGNLNYYQGRLKEAERDYQQVLKDYPDYQDARNGLANVRKAQDAAQRDLGFAGDHVWRIDGGVGLSDFDRDDIPEWDDQFLRVEYSPHSLAYHGSAQRYKRFGITDIEFKAGIADAVRGGWDWGLEAGFTPNATFRPDFNFGGRLGRAIQTQKGTTFYPQLTYSYDDYAAGVIHNIQPGLTSYLDNGLVLSGRLIATLQEAEKDQLGWLIEGRAPIADRWQIRAGYANAPEAIDGIAITTKSFFGGLTYMVSDDLDLHLNLARDDREDSFVRTSGNVGFTYKR
ncbi:YaiO family outer membrane beta-barrel protein [Hellea balneolensis]|uniref:YaiO family outer membrane beta-barrel protein n=1 Tax=Hellea balneolensis TaxID=287478 RepID=UPI000420D52C|nr:YaiO family outer membrane beta-barrel protein [Hellea balneolensis]